MVKLAETILRSTELSIAYSPCYVSGLRTGMKARNSINKALFVMLKEGLNDSKLAHNGWCYEQVCLAEVFKLPKILLANLLIACVIRWHGKFSRNLN